MSFADRREAIGTSAYWLHNWPQGYGFAALVVAAATALRFGVAALIPFHAPYTLFYPAIVLVAMLAGVGPGMFATLLATILGSFFFLEPRNSFEIRSAEGIVEPVLFSIIGLFLTFLAGNRKQAELALGESEADLNRAQAVAHIGSWRHDIRKNTLVLSGEACRIMGLPPGASVTPEQMIEKLHPEHRERIRGNWVGALARGEYDAEERVLVGGCTRWVRIQATVERDREGRSLGVVGTVQDITDRKQAERSLTLFRTLIDQSNDAVEVVDPETLCFLDINEKACVDLGYTREELLGMTVFDINPNVTESSRTKVVERLRASGFVVQEGVHRRKDASIFPVEISLRYVQLDRSYVVVVSRDISDRKRAEDSLRESEDRYRDLVEHSEDLVCTHDLEGRLLSVNGAPARILGFEVAELLKMPMRELIAPEFRDQFDAYLARMKENGSDKGLLCMMTRSGERRIWEYNNTLRTEGVAAPIARGMARDITEKKRSEAALRRSEQQYRMLFEKTVAGVGILSFEGQVLDCNDAWAHMFGHGSATECRGSQIADCYPNPAERGALLGELKRSGAFFNRELQLRRKDGTLFWILLNSVLLREGENPPLIQSTIFDITARKRAEQSLRDAKEFSEKLIQTANVVVLGLDKDGNVNLLNDAGEKITGYTFAELNGKNWSTLVPRDRFPHVWAEFDRLLGGEAGATFENPILTKTGEERHIMWRNSTVKINGQIVATISFGNDVTERKRAEEIIRQSEERFRVALKGSPIAVFTQDRDLRYTWIYNFATLPFEEVVGKTDEEIIGPDKARRLSELKHQVLETGLGAREEIVILHKGTNHAYDVTLEPLFDAQGSVVGITGAAMDIARLRELADGLQEAKDKLVQEKMYLQHEIAAELGFEEIIGQSAALREVLKKARIVAPTDSTVLLLGETGTGKELVARAVHRLSSRREKNFIKLNCAAVPSGLLESELLGHEKGAFTGAVSQKVGRIELADGGTLFLDEIGELPLELQPKLLRVLQDREFERLGGVHTVRVDVRIISATNRDLHKDVEHRKFREDLFYRLNVFPIQSPALRERRSDIPILVHHFVHKHAGRMGKPIEDIPSETMEVLQKWNWPGNIRELENMIERMVILTKGRVLAAPPVELEALQEVGDDDLTEMEREHIIRVLRETSGVLSGADGAASRLGIKRTTLQSMLKRFRIEPRDYRRRTGTFGRE